MMTSTTKTKENNMRKFRTTAYRSTTREKVARLYQDEGTIGVEALIDMLDLEPAEFNGIQVYQSRVYIAALCGAIEKMHHWQDDAEEMFNAANEDEKRELRLEKPILDEIIFVQILCDEVEKNEEPILVVQQAIDCVEEGSDEIK